MNINLKNIENYYYHAPLFMGSHGQAMDLIWDTGSSWTVVEGNQCLNCDKSTYQTKKSRFYDKLDCEIDEIFYGSGYVAGMYSQDAMYLDKN